MIITMILFYSRQLIIILILLTIFVIIDNNDNNDGNGNGNDVIKHQYMVIE